jgi:hypothetical protein
VNSGELASDAAREYPADNVQQQDIGARISATTICGQFGGRIKTFIVTFFSSLVGPQGKEKTTAWHHASRFKNRAGPPCLPPSFWSDFSCSEHSSVLAEKSIFVRHAASGFLDLRALFRTRAVFLREYFCGGSNDPGKS